MTRLQAPAPPGWIKLPCSECGDPVRTLASHPPMVPVMCVTCAFWRGATLPTLLVPGESVDPYVYWEDLDSAGATAGVAVTITRYRGGERPRHSVRVYCLGLPPSPLQPNAFIRRGH